MTGTRRRGAAMAIAAGLLGATPAWAEATPDVPTLSFWGKVILVVALIAVGVIAMRRGGSDPGE